MANALRDSETRALDFSNAPVYDRRDLGQVGRGTADSYLSAIMAAPEWLLQKMMKDDHYKKGVLQSGPQDRMKGDQFAWERYQADQAQNRDYAQGQDYGTGLGLVADPFIDALGAIPAVGKALKLQKGAKAKPINALSDVFRDEAGVIRAYHGTPHDVDKFSMANIGTGEGAQAYGHGLYFAENADVAKSYAPRDFGQEAEFMELYKGAEKRNDYEKMELYEAAMMHETPNQIRATYTLDNGYPQSMVDKAEQVAFTTERVGQKQGGLYKVDLDVNQEDLLDWDLPLSEQPAKIRDMFKPDANGKVRMPNGEVHEAGKLTGEKIYRSMVEGALSHEGAVEKFSSGGVPGIRYLDGDSRSIGKGSRNVVMFNEDLINILGKE